MRSVTPQELDQLKLEGKKLFVDYYAPWCGPSITLIPRLEIFENEYTDVTFVKINIAEHKKNAEELGIGVTPTTMVFNGNQLVNRSIGVNQDIFYKKLLDPLQSSLR